MVPRLSPLLRRRCLVRAWPAGLRCDATAAEVLVRFDRPSVALATLALTLRAEGAPYTATEARSMVIGAIATGAYAWACSHVMWKASISVRVITLAGLLGWLAVALLGWFCALRAAA